MPVDQISIFFTYWTVSNDSNATFTYIAQWYI